MLHEAVSIDTDTHGNRLVTGHTWAWFDLT